MQIHRVLLVPIACASLLMTAGCHSRNPVPQLSPDDRLNSFVEELRQQLEGHEWNEILEVADPAHYRVQVTEHGMPEPQYVAELLSLNHVDNSIRRGESVTWSDLERIGTVQFDELTRSGDRHTLTGTVRLADGETLQLRARIVQQQGRFRLTGALG